MALHFKKRIARRLDDAAQLFGFILPPRLGLFARMLMRILLGRISVDAAQMTAVRNLPEEAVVVYVAKHSSRLERLFAPARLAPEGLPGGRVGFGHLTIWCHAFPAALKLILSKTVYFLRYFRLPDPYVENSLPQALLADGAFMHLVAPRIFAGRFNARSTDPLAFLIAWQRNLDRPVFLVPQLFFYSRGPGFGRRSLIASLFGLDPRAGLVERLGKLLLRPREVFVELGKPVFLESLVRTLDDGFRADTELALAIRQKMMERINRHRSGVTGPVFPSTEEIRQRVLSGEPLMRFMKKHARRRNVSLHRVRREAVAHLDDIAARPNPYILRLGLALADRMVARLFDELVVAPDHSEAVREASRRGPVVLIPCHKSHMDSLVLSWVLHRNRLPCPYIFAGRNLAFWPMGWLLRRLGAFFVRRSFKGAIFYALVFSEYIHLLLEQGAGTHIAAFIEGTRSRSGKLLAPQAGMLAVLVNAVKNGACKDLSLVPVFIGYDRVPDEKGYLHEVRGGEKRPESFRRMLGAWRAMGRRYGKIHVNFAAPVSLRGAIGNRGGNLERMTPQEVNRFSRALGATLLAAVNSAGRITPRALVCAALLAGPSRGIARERFLETVQSFLHHVAHRESALTESLVRDPVDAVAHALGDLIRSRQVEVISGPVSGDGLPEVFRVRPARRMDLDFFKNNAIAFFAPAALAAAAVLRADVFQFSASALRGDFGYLADLMEKEFPRPDDGGDERRLRKVLKSFIDDGMLVPHPSLPDTYRLTAAGYRRMIAYASLVAPLLESYMVVLRYLDGGAIADLRGTERLKRIQRLGRRMHRRGEVQRREALSSVNYANALAAFSGFGVTGKPTGDAAGPHLRALGEYLKRIPDQSGVIR